MKKTSALFITALALICALLPARKLVALSATIVWQTTFNCNEWDQSMGLNSINCDGLGGYGAWTTPGHPNGDQITLPANNPIGGGGRGFRHWRADGVNSNGGSIQFVLPNPLQEFWIRFYMRYQAGFQWLPSAPPNYTKDMYWHSGPVFTLGFHSSNSWGFSLVSTGQNWYGPIGWTTVMKGATSDGLFHCYEGHAKMDTNGNNGIAESWIDGTLVHSNSTVNWGTTGSFQEAEIGDNQNAPNNGVEMYTDYDDFAVSNSGRVGCLAGSGAGPTPPAAPTNVRIVP